jgi:hypothetical protein
MTKNGLAHEIPDSPPTARPGTRRPRVTPFCQGLPGSINAVPMPCATIHDSSAFDTNSGPLSLRKKAGGTTLAHQARQHFDHARRADATVHVDRQSLLGELVGDGQALELLTVGAAIEHEVVGPIPGSAAIREHLKGHTHGLSTPVKI